MTTTSAPTTATVSASEADLESASDPYPSRIGRPPELLHRRHPVVHEGGQGPLDAASVRRFDERGFLNVQGSFSPDEVRELDGAIDDLVDRLTATMAEAETAKRLVIEPSSNAIRSIFSFHEESGPLQEVVSDDRLAGVARQLLASDVYVHQSRVNRKPGFRGEDFGWHSDFETWHTEDGMPTPRCLSASVALTDNHPFNGPLMVMPGSHYWFVTCPEPTPPANFESSLEEQKVGVPDDESLQDLYDKCGIEQCTGDAGSVTFFDCNVMHGSNTNISPLPRRNLFIVFNSIENTLVDPFSAPDRRPEHLASRRFDIV
jgi:ectoine hydroxylase